MRALALILLTLPAMAAAQEQDGAADSNRKYKYAERTEIEFDQRELKGVLDGPSVITVTETPHMEFGSLYQPRTNFSDEMHESVSLVK